MGSRPLLFGACSLFILLILARVGTSEEAPDIYFAASTDGGLTWTDPNVRVDDSGWGYQAFPSLGVDSVGNLYAAWMDNRVGDAIYSSMSTDGGANWTQNIRVDDTMGGERWYPSLASYSVENVFPVWSDTRDGPYHIYFTKSTDGGQNWLSPNVRVNDMAPAERYRPSLCVGEDGILYACWVDTQGGIFFARSTDAGMSWTDPNVRASDSTQVNHPSINVDAIGNVYIAWQKGLWDTTEIHFARSTDGGNNWSDPVVVNDSTAGNHSDPSLVSDPAGNLYLAWTDTRNGDADIYFARSTDQGLTWTQPNVKVNDSAGGVQDRASLDIDTAGNIYIAWTDYRGDTIPNIYFAKSADGGASWTAPSIQVDDSSANYKVGPSLALDRNGNIAVAWSDGRNAPGVEEEIPLLPDITLACLLQNYPNPFARETQIAYSVWRIAKTEDAIGYKPLAISFKVYDLSGRVVRTLVDEVQPPGRYQVRWDGRDRSGERVSVGVYFYRLKVDSFVATRKMLMIR